MLDPAAIGHLLGFSLYEGLAYGFLALGVYLTFRVLGFPDLTVDGSFVLGAGVVAVLIISGVNPFLATLGAIGAGICAGLVTSLLNTKLRIPALLASILVMVGLYSINLRIMGRPNLSLLREVTIYSLASQLPGLESSLVYKLVVALVLGAVVFFVLNWFLRTEIGLALRATGDNEQMVRGAGVDTDKTTILGVAIANGLVALCGGVVAQAQRFVDVNMGVGMIIMGLAAVIIGEALFRPKGIVRLLLAVFGGAFIYRLVLSIALRAGMEPGDLKLVTAVIVIIALAAPYLQKRIRREWLPPAARW